MRPIIAVTVADYPEYDGLRLRGDYFRRVWAAGGLPLLLPSLPATVELLEQLTQTLDGLLISGGGDYDLARPAARDSLELALIQAAWERKLPILGICRGMQGLVLALGGTLWADLSERPETALDHDQPVESRHQPSHGVELLPPLAEIYGVAQLPVNSHHHQGLRQIPPQLQVIAYADDSLAEAVAPTDGSRFALGVQWHPEALPGHDAPFLALVAAAMRWRAKEGR